MINWLALFAGIFLSITSGYFSIIGLGEIFSASFWAVVIMGTAIEIGKVVAATWLHRNWSNSLVSKLHKFYLSVAIILAMFITSLGIFGFLSQAHINQTSSVINEITSVSHLETQLTNLQKDLENQQKNLDDINRIADEKDRMNIQRSRVLREIDRTRSEIKDINKKLLDNKQITSEVSVKLGPVKYLANLLYTSSNTEDIDKAVQLFICIIMIVFDPLAIMLILSSSVGFSMVNKKKKVSPSGSIDKDQPLENPQTQVKSSKKLSNGWVES